MSSQNLLIFADSDHDANMLYAVRMFVPDAFIYLQINGKCHIVMSDLEIDRARSQAPHCRVFSLTQCRKKLQERGIKKPGTHHVVRHILKLRRTSGVLVPENFPLGLAKELAKLKVSVRVKRGLFFPKREMKTAEEVKKISAALMMAEVGLAEGIQAIKQAKVNPRKRLIYHNAPLTSEKVRGIINTAIVQAGGLACNTIVAGGKQACDPHERGHGVLQANEPIIIDVFPRSQRTGYFGDITRTVVKGRASDAVRRMYYTVERAQEVTFENLRHKAHGKQVHERVQEFFEAEGYKTGRVRGRMQGFFHGTGHGLGLEVHEAPRVGPFSTDRLRNGHVVTVEPGLYYPEVGGVRLEDVAYLTRSGPRNLTKFEKVLEL
jgi:Xaa-Pro aminopeptidase